MSTDVKIPEWNHVILVNDFNDGYWDDDFEFACPEAFKALTNLKPKYSQPGMYMEPIKIYNKYIDIAYEFYGGEMAVRFIQKKTGMLPKGIVPRPALNKKGAKKYVAGATYDSGVYVPELSAEQREKLSEKYIMDVNPEDIHFSEEKIPRQIRRAIRRGVEEVQARRNARASYKESSALYTTDVISQVMLNADKILEDPYTNLDDINASASGMSLEDHVREYDKRHEHDDEEYREIDAPIDDVNDMYSYANSYTSAYRQRLANDTYVLKIMRDAGMSIFTDRQLMHMSPDMKVRYRNVFGGDAMMTKKEFKKYSKKYEKDTKKYQKEVSKHRASADRALANLLSSRSIINVINEEMDD